MTTKEFRRVLCTAFIERNGKYLMCKLNPETKEKLKLDDAEWTGVVGEQQGFEMPGETIKRVVFEKTGFTMQRYKMKNAIEFWDRNRQAERVHCFHCDKFKGKLVQEDEYGTYEWIPKEEIGNLKLWRADRLFFKKNMEEGMKFFYFQGLYTFSGKYVRASLFPSKDLLKPEEWDV